MGGLLNIKVRFYTCENVWGSYADTHWLMRGLYKRCLWCSDLFWEWQTWHCLCFLLCVWSQLRAESVCWEWRKERWSYMYVVWPCFMQITNLKVCSLKKHTHTLIYLKTRLRTNSYMCTCCKIANILLQEFHLCI